MYDVWPYANTVFWMLVFQIQTSATDGCAMSLHDICHTIAIPNSEKKELQIKT